MAGFSASRARHRRPYPGPSENEVRTVRPELPPTGILYALINGEIVLDDGIITDELPGVPLPFSAR